MMIRHSGIACVLWAVPATVLCAVLAPRVAFGEEAQASPDAGAATSPEDSIPFTTAGPPPTGPGMGGEEPALPSRTTGVSVTDEGAIAIDVYGGVRDLYKIAVPLPGGLQGPALTVQSVASRDLELSSLFKVLDPRSFLADPDQTGFDVDAWRAVGAQGVIQGEVSKAGAKVRLELKLHETARGQAPVLARTYNGSDEDVRNEVHQFVNEVINYFTGEPGVFGSRILFSRYLGRGHKEIFSVEMDGSNLQGHTNNGSINVLPAWGPGGGGFYTSFVNGWAQVFRTGRREPVLGRSGLNMGVAVAPGGGQMAVVLSEDGNSDIYLANLDGSGLRNITNHPAIDVSPSWSPDGSQIAFVSNRHGSPQIFVMDAGGGGAHRVTYAGSYNQTPAWYPRGDTPLIAFTGADGGTYDIFTVNAGGGGITRLTQAQGRNSDPAWSPDGRLIAFWSSRGGIHLMTPEGLNQQLILRGHAETLRWGPVGLTR
jgi:TolB protein